MPVRCSSHKLVISAASSVPAVPSRAQLGTRNPSASALSALGRSWAETEPVHSLSLPYCTNNDDVTHNVVITLLQQ